MSSYIDSAINLRTGKIQEALFYDDFYGRHRYGVGFRKDGRDAELASKINPDEWFFIPLEVYEKQYLTIDKRRSTNG